MADPTAHESRSAETFIVSSCLYWIRTTLGPASHTRRSRRPLDLLDDVQAWNYMCLQQRRARQHDLTPRGCIIALIGAVLE